MDEILDFYYDKDSFQWRESDLYQFLCNHYGLDDILIETLGGMIVVKKHNVVGYVEGDDFITVYESAGELNNKVHKVFLDTIYSIEVLI